MIVAQGFRMTVELAEFNSMSKLLNKYLKKIEQEKEKKRLELLQKAKEALNKLSDEISFEKAYIFGSILKNKKFYYDSDIDIAVCGLEDKDFFYFMSRASDILGRDVDIVQIETHRLKDKIIKGGLVWKKEG